MKIKGLALLGIIGILPIMAMGQGTIDPNGWVTDKAPISFKTDTKPREGEFPVGLYVGGSLGANVAQDGTLDLTSPFFPGSTVSLKTKNSLGGTAGIRAGYSWLGWDNFISNFAPASVGKEFSVLPTIQGSFYWTGYEYRAKETFGGVEIEFTTDANVYVLALEPLLKFQIGSFRPYFGVGIGGAYLTADNATVGATGLGSTKLDGSDDSFAFAVEALAGTEYFFSQSWSVSLDYKYLALINPEFDSPDKSVHYSFDSLGNHIITAGINFYF